MAFTNFPGRVLRKTEWLTAIADPANWSFGPSGTLPAGAFTVLPPPLFSALSVPAHGGAVSGVGRHDAGSIVRLTAVPSANYVLTRWEDGSTNPVRDYVMPDQNTTVAARFGWKGTVILVR